MLNYITVGKRDNECELHVVKVLAGIDEELLIDTFTFCLKQNTLIFSEARSLIERFFSKELYSCTLFTHT